MSVLTVLTVAFFAAIAFLGYRMFRQYRFELESLPERQRLALYASIGLALVTFTATNRLFDVGGGGVLAWFALLGLASYGLYLGLDAVPQLRLALSPPRRTRRAWGRGSSPRRSARRSAGAPRARA